MDIILKPAVGLLGKLRFPYKFGLILTVVMLPLVVLSFVMVASINDKLALLENESRGLEYIKTIRLPLDHIQQHRGMISAFHNGAYEFRERIIKERGEVDLYITELEAVDQRLGSSLNTDGLVNDIKASWKSIKQNSFSQEMVETINEHNALVAKLLDLTRHISDHSEISLDPTLDSYYLGTSLVLNLPMLIENMGKARAVSSGIAAKKTFTPDTFISLSVLEGNIEVFSENADISLKSALSYNADLAKKLKDSIDKSYASIEQMKSMMRNDLMNADTITIESDEAFNIATSAINDSYALFDDIVPELAGLFEARIAEQTLYKYIALLSVASVLMLVIYLFTALYDAIKKNISAVGKSIESIADGKLFTRLEIETKDEMQQIAVDFNNMAEKFEALVQQIISATGQLASTAEESAQISKESETNLMNQRMETEQVATAMNEMSATVQEVARSAAEAASAASNADSEATAGKTVVKDTSDSIVGLASEVENTAGVIQNLAKESEDIGAVLDVIKGIAEQTNLLALNAAIEAARAGEQGRGFAVVADEVRTLASRTQDSTKEIESMIERLQIGANNAVSVIDTGRQKAQAGVEHTSHAAETLESITAAVTVINQMNTQIASAAEEQSATTEEMNRNIIRISQLTEETSNGATQSSTANAELSALASHLKDLVSQFKMTA